LPHLHDWTVANVPAGTGGWLGGANAVPAVLPAVQPAPLPALLPALPPFPIATLG